MRGKGGWSEGTELEERFKFFLHSIKHKFGHSCTIQQNHNFNEAVRFKI